MFQPCLRFLSTVLEAYFDRAQGMLRPSSRYVSTDLPYDLTMHEVYFDRRSKYVSTVVEYA